MAGLRLTVHVICPYDIKRDALYLDVAPRSTHLALGELQSGKVSFLAGATNEGWRFIFTRFGAPLRPAIVWSNTGPVSFFKRG